MRGRGSDVAAIAALVQRLAVLLAAGIPPVAAWGYLEEGEPARQVAAMCAAGATIPAAIVDAAARRGVAIHALHQDCALTAPLPPALLLGYGLIGEQAIPRAVRELAAAAHGE